MSGHHPIELLAPAGGMDKLEVGLRFGADAVYFGGKTFNLRAKSSNFSKDDLKTAVEKVHSFGKKAYVTLNIIAHDREIKALPNFVKYLEQIGVDAVIVADLGVFDIVVENSSLAVHVSTQASNTNWRSVKVWQKLGAKRVVLAREMTLDEIKKIKDQVPEMELEVFVHGAMCMTYSGRCNLSNYFAERDGNRGVCSNTCRWKYSVVEEKRPGEYFPVYEDETGTYMYNSKDLCTIEFIDKILDAGVTGLKIEGRMKSALYCGVTTKAYRSAIDSYLSGQFHYDPHWLADLKSYSHRGYTSGFFLGQLDQKSERLSGGYDQTHRFVGMVREKVGEGSFVVDIFDKILLGTEIEALKPSGLPLKWTLKKMIRNDSQVEVAQPNMRLILDAPVDLAPFDLLRVRGTREQISTWSDFADQSHDSVESVGVSSEL